jgi:hypothetical protein
MKPYPTDGERKSLPAPPSYWKHGVIPIGGSAAEGWRFSVLWYLLKTKNPANQ